MRAVVYDRYGSPDVLRLDDVPMPVCGEGEVLVKVHAATVNRLDCHVREAERSYGRLVSGLSRLAFGVRGPRRRILGSEFAGEVEAVGAGVNDFNPGDRVFGNTGIRFGAHAEYVCVKADRRIARIPPHVGYEQAAPATDGGLNSLNCLHAGQVSKGTTVLVYGASGAIGTAGVQLAKHLGAVVTAVSGPKGMDVVRSLGPDHLIDYTQEDFTKNGKTYEVIFDAVGKHSFARCRGSLAPGGRYLPTDGLANFLLALRPSRPGAKRVAFQLRAGHPREDLQLLAELLGDGSYRPVIDRTYPLGDVVEAARYVETQQKVGNVVLMVR